MPITTILARQQAASGSKYYRGYGLPAQTVSVAEKEDEQWIMGCMNFFADEARRQTREKVSDTKKYKLLDPEYQYPKNTWVFDPLFLGEKKDEMYGATDPIQHFPIMNQPLNTIWGERINRNYNFYCLSDTPASFNEYSRIKTELLFDEVSQNIQNRALQKALRRVQSQGIEISQEIMQQVQEEAQTMSAPSIQRYMDKDYVDVIEQSSNRIVKNIWRTNNLDDEFLEGFRHGTLCGKEAYAVEVNNGKIVIRNLNPFSLFSHKSPSERWISKGQFAGYRVWLTPSSIIDRYRDKLTIADIEHLEGKLYPNSKAGGVNSLSGIKSISYDTQTYADQFGTTFRDLNMDVVDQMLNEYMITGTNVIRAGSIGLVEVVQAYWKSYRKAGVLHFYNEMDEEETMWVDENYEEDKDAGEWVKWYYLNQVYQGTLIDEDIHLDVMPYPHQTFDFDDPDFSPLPIEGCHWNDYNGKTIALADLMMPWQEMYDIVAYELRRDMKKAIGKVMFMSIDHIPTIPGFTMEKWMYWCREFGIAWVGAGKQRSQFSHYSSQDMSFAEQLVAKMQMLDKIAANCASFAGFSPPRLADTTKEETAQQSELSNRNSVNQTEYYFWKHSQAIQRVLTLALDIGRRLLKSGQMIQLRNMYDDMDQRYLETDAANIRSANVNLFIVHGSEAIRRTEAVKQMAMSAAGKTGDGLDMADIMLSQTENEIKQQLREIRRMREQQMQADRQKEIQIQELQNKDKAEERAWQREKHYSELESEERQEYMRSFMNQDDNLKDVNGNETADILEGQSIIQKQSADLQKHQRELRKQDIDDGNKKKELSIKEQEVRIKQDSLKVDRENMKNDKEIANINARNRNRKS